MFKILRSGKRKKKAFSGTAQPQRLWLVVLGMEACRKQSLICWRGAPCELAVFSMDVK